MAGGFTSIVPPFARLGAATPATPSTPAAVLLTGHGGTRPALAPLDTCTAVVVDGIDLVSIGVVDAESVDTSDNIRGFDQAKFAADGMPFRSAHHKLQLGQSVKVTQRGMRTFEGEITDVDMGSTPHEVTCDGVWERAKRRNDGRWGFLETDYGLFEVVDIATYKFNDYGLDTDGQLLFSIGMGSDLVAGASVFVGFKILDGYGDGAIGRITADINAMLGGGAAVYAMAYLLADRDGWDTSLGTETIGGPWTTGGAGTINFTPATYTNANRWLLNFAIPGSGTVRTRDLTFQLTNFCTYVNCVYAVTIPAAIGSIITGTGLASSSSMEASGSAVTSRHMFTDECTRAEAIETERSKLSVVYDVSCWEDNVAHGTVRPTSPPTAQRHLAIRASDLRDDDDWSLHIPAENRIDAVCCVYTANGVAGRVYYPSNPTAADARVPVYSIGECDATTALAAATQTYLQTNMMPAGGLTLYADQQYETISGSPVDPMHIRSLDWWVTRVDAPLDSDERGPFIVTSASRTGDGTITLGFDSDAYTPPGYEAATSSPGTYVGARKKRKRYRKKLAYSTWWRRRHKAYYKKHHRYPAMPKHHPKYVRVWAYKWVTTESYYR